MYHKRLLPPLGQRIIKTSIAVFLCFVFYMLEGGHGSAGSMCVTAILCMQPYVSDSKTFAMERICATLLGALWGLAFLLLMDVCPALGKIQLIAYFFMGLFTLLAIYSTVVLKRSQLAAMVAIVLISTIADFPNVQTPLVQTLKNLADTFVGTVIAIVVNTAHIPRKKHPEYLFFVRTKDLVPDRYRQIPSSVNIALESLIKDGANICLMSRWAPAFIMTQMGMLNVNVPMIIMDGAALYDVQDNRYLDVIDIPKEHANRLRSILASFHVGCNIYAVNERTLSIYRDGPVNEAEQKEFETMKRSPYRHYLDGMYREDDYIAFIRVIDEKEKIEELAYEIQSVLPIGMFRTQIREETRFPEYASLYFYSPKATTDEMKRRVQKIMESRTGTVLEAVDLRPKITKYLPEHDALILLSRLKNTYEPILGTGKWVR